MPPVMHSNPSYARSWHGLNVQTYKFNLQQCKNILNKNILCTLFSKPYNHLLFDTAYFFPQDIKVICLKNNHVLFQHKKGKSSFQNNFGFF